MAGALDVQLAGNAYYFGKLYEKPTIGDAIREIETEDIRYANRLMYATAILGVNHLCFVPRCVSVTGHKKEKKNDEARTWR